MSEPFYAEVAMLPYSYNPRDWAYCDGQLVDIAQNTALFSLVGTIFGGDGRTTFGLPNLKSRTPVGKGSGPGVIGYDLGDFGGAKANYLSVANLPSHNHIVTTALAPGTTDTPSSNTYLGGAGTVLYFVDQPDHALNVEMSTDTLSVAGENASVNNQQPFLAVSFCICMEGIYPPRN